MILLTSYASKMMQEAGESQDGLSTPIFNMDAQKWTPSGVIANPDLQQITLSNLVQKMKQSGASEQQIAMRVLQYQIAGQAIGSYSMAEQVDALYNSGVSLNTVINAITLRRGKALSAKEIQSITSRYNNKAGSLVTANGQVIKNDGHLSTASESRGAKQSGGKGKVDGAHAEIGSINQAHKAGLAKGADLKITVKGKDVCDYCKGDIAAAATAAGAKSVTIIAFDQITGITRRYHWQSGMKSIKEVK